MRELAIFALGAAAGMAIAFRLRPAPEASCCKRVAAGARAQIGERCGFLGGLCQGAGDALGVWDHAGAILDALKVPS